jgi:hypothetical protein
MKSNAKHLCPRCLIVKGDVPEIGTDLDMLHRSTNVRKYPHNHIKLAHNGLFDGGWNISYKGEHDILKSGSWAPTLVHCFSPPLSDLFTTPQQNAYYTELGLDPSPLMAVDLMHDVELGLKKQVLLHMLRIFHTVGKGTVQDFDTRSVPSKLVRSLL